MERNPRAALMATCRAKALRTLTINHKEEFTSLLAAEYDAAGLVVRTRVTGKAAKIARLQQQIEELEQSL